MFNTKSKKTNLKKINTTVRLYNKETGMEENEVLFQSEASNFLYNNKFGKLLMNVIFKRRFTSNLIGFHKNSKYSKKEILPFINTFKINVDEILRPIDSFVSFNDFFIRELKEGSRKVDIDVKSLISPADSKLLTYTIKNDTIIPFKGSRFTIYELLKNHDLANEYIDGVCLVFRLAPVDYHRFCYIDDGYHQEITPINGNLHSVNNFALSSGTKVFQENYREYCVLHTKNIKKVIHIDVGAIGVGRIKQHNIKGCSFKKGQEKGYFEFGGSTIILLFKKNTVKIDSDILKYSENGIETIVKYGSKIGDIILYSQS